MKLFCLISHSESDDNRQHYVSVSIQIPHICYRMKQTKGEKETVCGTSFIYLLFTLPNQVSSHLGKIILKWPLTCSHNKCFQKFFPSYNQIINVKLINLSIPLEIFQMVV